MTMNSTVTLFELVHRHDIDAYYDEPYHGMFHGHLIMVCMCSEEVWIGEPVDVFDKWSSSRLCLLDTTNTDHVLALEAWLDDGNVEHIHGIWR